MPREFSRSRRVGEEIQRELAVLIREEVSDPRVGMVTISGVEVSKDLAHARVYVTRMEGAEGAETAVQGLTHAAGYLRHRLAERMALRRMPRLRFMYDDSVERGFRLDALIDEAVSEDESRGES